MRRGVCFYNWYNDETLKSAMRMKGETLVLPPFPLWTVDSRDYEN